MSRYLSLVYHGLDREPADDYQVSFEDFRRQVRFLQSADFTVEGFPGLSRRLSTGLFPEKYVVLTFDDGCMSDLFAARALHNAGCQATFFLSQKLCQEADGYLKAGEIREVAQLCSVGSHGVTHRLLSELPLGQVREELVQSKLWLAELVGKPVEYLALPGGFGSRAVLRETFNSGYTLVGNSREITNSPRRTCRRRVVNRIAVRRNYGLERFQQLVTKDPLFLFKRHLRTRVLDLSKAVLSTRQFNRFKGLFHRFRE